ncbi:hypothetical protein HMI54_002166 [Coelomomyces lativittatus]|nr:hypothetical protein HMI56_007519 [Coelomomyces lativittatus]KAJ1517084.1 hypothetical protein HMI55_000668 [Coelomomyces lativittatus]KAJ1518177.1 hypothetical protein HMI54_002166 [Coelomomyces lativittatus]
MESSHSLSSLSSVSIQPFLSMSLNDFYNKPLHLTQCIQTAQTQLIQHAQSTPEHFITLFSTLQSISSPFTQNTTSTEENHSSRKEDLNTSTLPNTWVLEENKKTSQYPRDPTVFLAWDHLHVLETHQSLLSSWLQLPKLCQEALHHSSTWESAFYLISNVERAWSLSDPLDPSHPWLHNMVHACFRLVHQQWLPPLIHTLQESEELDELVTALRYLKKITPLLHRLPLTLKDSMPSSLLPLSNHHDPEVHWIHVFLEQRRHYPTYYYSLHPRPSSTHSPSFKHPKKPSSLTSPPSIDPLSTWVDPLDTFHAHLTHLVPIYLTLFPSPTYHVYLYDTLYQNYQVCFQTYESFGKTSSTTSFPLLDRVTLLSLLRRWLNQTSTTLMLPHPLLHPSLMFTLALDPLLLLYVRTHFHEVFRQPGPWTLTSIQRVMKTLESVTSIYVPVSVLPDLAKELSYLCQSSKEGYMLLRTHVLGYWQVFLDTLEHQSWQDPIDPGEVHNDENQNGTEIRNEKKVEEKNGMEDWPLLTSPLEIPTQLENLHLSKDPPCHLPDALRNEMDSVLKTSLTQGLDKKGTLPKLVVNRKALEIELH